MDRKHFLQLSSLAFLGLYSCKNNLSLNPKHKLGIQLYTVRNEISKDVEKTLEKLAKLGYTELEIYGYNGTFFGKTAKEFSSILKNNGLKVISSHHLLAEFQNLNSWKKTCDDLAELQAKFMVCAWLSDTERNENTYLQIPDILDQASEISRKNSIKIAYHNHDFEFINQVKKQAAYDFLLENTSKEILFEMDLYWMKKADKNPIEYFNKFPGRFPLWHVKDLDPKDGSFTEIGNGNINFQEIFAAKEKAGLQYWFVEQDESKRNIFESINLSKDYILKNSFFKN